MKYKCNKTALAILALLFSSFGSASLQASAENAALWNEWNQLTRREKNGQFGKFAKRCDDNVMLKKAYDQLAPGAKVSRFLKFVQYCSDVEMIWDVWKQLIAVYPETRRLPNEAVLPDELKVRYYLQVMRGDKEDPDGIGFEKMKRSLRRFTGFRSELLDAIEKLVDVMKF